MNPHVESTILLLNFDLILKINNEESFNAFISNRRFQVTPRSNRKPE
jgi:hypothetical protein